MNVIIEVKNDTSTENITKCYQRKSKEHPFGSKLSNIREEMREFCDSMDRFVDENKIVLKNGQVEGFWGEQTTKRNLQRDVEDREIRDTEIKVSTNEEGKLHWWNNKERKLKVKEIIKKLEDEATIKEAKFEDKRKEESPSQDNKRTADTANNFQNVYDLMTLKTCPNIFPDSRETYYAKDYECERSTKIQGERSRDVFDNLFAELRHRDSPQEMRKPNVSSELMTLEETPYLEKSTIDMEEKSVSVIINTTTQPNLIDSDGQFSNRDNIIEDKSGAKTEILEDQFCSFSFEPSDIKKDIDESDDDSFKTATSIQEDPQILENTQESLDISKLSDENNSQIIDLTKDESIDESVNKEGHNDASYENKENERTEKFSDKIEPSISKEQKLSTGIEKSDSQVKSLVRTMKHLSLQKTSQSSRFRGKRIREAEDIEISNKRSFLGEEMNGRKSEERKSRSQISERCRQHLIQEAKKFTKKVSPLIDRCITTLIRDTENVNEKSRWRKYGRRSLTEDLTSGFALKMNLDKTAGDSGEGNNPHDKFQSEFNDIAINAHSETRESTAKRTFNSKPAVLSDDSGKNM